MSLSALVATGMLAVLIAFVAMVVVATMRQIGDESRRAAEERDR